jgi:hypothetical protein
MNLIKPLSCVFALVLTIFSGCKKETPAPTTADYFTCDINGKHWVAISFDPATLFAVSYTNQNMFMLEGIDSALKTVKIVLLDTSTNNNTSGTFLLSYFPYNTSGYQHNYGSFYEKTTKDPGYCTDSVYTGTFIMTFSKGTKRASGTFEFKARYYDAANSVSKEVNITNGKFSTAFSEIQ